MSKKPIKITLYHAHWCGHCKDFIPTWDWMRSCPYINEITNFADYEDEVIQKLDDSEKTINGKNIGAMGFPTIRIRVNNNDYVYEGDRTPEDIYKSIVDKLSGLKGVDKKVTITKTNDAIDITTTEQDDEMYNNNRKKRKIGRSSDVNDIPTTEQDGETHGNNNEKKRKIGRSLLSNFSFFTEREREQE